MIKTIIKNKYDVKDEYEIIKLDDIGYYVDMWYLCFAGIAVDESLTIMRTSLVKPDAYNLAQALTDITKTKIGTQYSFINDMLNDEYIRSYTDNESKHRNIHQVGNHKCTLVKNRYRLSFNIDDKFGEKIAHELSNKITKNSFADKYFIDSFFLYESMDMMLKTNIGYIICDKMNTGDMYSFFKEFYPSLDNHICAQMAFNIVEHSIYRFNDSSRYVALDVYPNNIFMGR